MRVFFYISILSLIFLGCDIFDTRTAEEPVQSRSNYEQAVTPEILIENLTNSFTDKNVDNYLSTFSSSEISGKEFNYEPSSAAALQFAGLFENWDIINEREYFNNLKAIVPEDKTITLELTNSTSSNLGDSLIYTATYLLTVPNNDPELPVNYQGDLQFSMIRNTQAVWSIYYWQDIKGNSNSLPSWSELKGWLAN